MKNLKEILYKAKQETHAKKKLHSTETLATAFHKYEGEANPYVWFEYVPQKIWNKTLEQVSVSMDSDPINTNK